jgi:NAD(P)-dependent dehydrogenase (short-subunit alcohol dehydrogenase family)
MTASCDTNLNGQVVVITGAGEGLGRAYALRTAAAGGRVVINDVNQATVTRTGTLIRQAGGQVAMHVGSVQDPATGPQLVELALAEFGELDAIILNAGIMDVSQAVDCVPAEMKRAFEVNVLGAMLCGVPALRRMAEQGRGSILFVTSGARFGMTGITTYGATKGAIASLSWGWAAEAAEHGVRVNALSPFAQTAMFDLNPAFSAGPTPESIAPAAVYLASAANDLNGQVVRFNGSTLSIHLDHGSRMTDDVTRSQWSTADVAAVVAELKAAHPSLS